MKASVFALLFVFLMIPAFSQDSPFVKKIEVMGSAEKEIVPDEIYLSVSLREYKLKNNDIVSIEKLENQLARAVKEMGVKEEDFQIENIYGNNYWWRKKKEDPEFLATKRYRLKLNDLNKVNNLLSKLDPLGVENMNISEYSHSRIEEFRKELKVEALKAAKEKAQYLVESIDQELGEAIEIYETEGGGPVYPMAQFRMASNVAMDAEAGQDIGFRTMKLRAEIRVVFRLN